MKNDFFLCSNCQSKVSLRAIGTHNRNHCPCCLWSRHIDEKTPGDRKSRCGGLTEPVGLTFKDGGVDKYGKKIQGEIMIVHRCQICGKETKNRIAGDDDADKVFLLAEEKDKREVKKQLWGDLYLQVRTNFIKNC